MIMYTKARMGMRQGVDMNYYSVSLDLRKLNCLVIGGGAVAYRKAKSLLECNAQVLIVSPELTTEFSTLIQDHNKAQWIANPYEEKYLDQINIVIAATNDSGVNEQIYTDATARGVLVNVVDQPELCNFILPAVVSKGDIHVAVCTGGAAPLVSVLIRNKLKTLISEGWVAMAAQLKIIRNQIRVLEKTKKNQFWSDIKNLNPDRYTPDQIKHIIRQTYEKIKG